MNDKQKAQLKEKYLAFKSAYDDFTDFAYTIDRETGYACDLISIDRILDIKDNLEDLGVLEVEDEEE